MAQEQSFICCDEREDRAKGTGLQTRDRSDHGWNDRHHTPRTTAAVVGKQWCASLSEGMACRLTLREHWVTKLTMATSSRRPG